MQESDDLIYQLYQEQKAQDWENLCRRCGACCGIVEGDPCEHLLKAGNGLYACRIYQNRSGLHKTVSGKPFNCVPIRQILDKFWPGDECCGYKKKSNIHLKK